MLLRFYWLLNAQFGIDPRSFTFNAWTAALCARYISLSSFA